jgi:hypothetical protein
MRLHTATGKPSRDASIGDPENYLQLRRIKKNFELQSVETL